MRVPVDTERGFTSATSESMFRLSAYAFPSWGRKYDISPDGQRFVFLKRAGSQTGEDASPPHVIVVLNWLEELKRLVPTN